MASPRETDVVEIDRFLAEAKTLAGPLPGWGRSGFFGRNGAELMATWPIMNSLGIVGKGQLRFSIKPGKVSCPSMSLLYGGRSVLRLDIEEGGVCESNPHWSQYMGIPATVCGSHLHTWEHNRQFILDQDKWELPCRIPLPPRIHRLDQAIPWLAGEVNISLAPDQHGFRVPSELF